MSQTPKQLSAVPNLPDFYVPPAERGPQLEQVEARYAALPGQPSIVYFEPATETVVSICPTPQLGMVAVMPNTLNFPVIAHRTGKVFSKEDATKYMEIAANKIDLGQLCGEEADSIEYSLALDSEPVQDAHGIGYRGIMCVPVSPQLFAQNLSIAMMQGLAAKKIAEAMKLDASQETKH
jgi:hypothetical protein